MLDVSICALSNTIAFFISHLQFLKAAAEKKLRFTVVVCEGAPHYEGHDMAKSLASVGIDTCVIHDSN